MIVRSDITILFLWLILSGCAHTTKHNDECYYARLMAREAIARLQGDDYSDLLVASISHAKSKGDELYLGLLMVEYCTASRLSFYLNNDIKFLFRNASDEVFLSAFKRLPSNTQRLIGWQLIRCSFGPEISLSFSHDLAAIYGSHEKSWRYISAKYYNEQSMRFYDSVFESKRGGRRGSPQGLETE